MNPFKLRKEESFTMGESNLESLLDSPYKIGQGMILYCYSGTANISVDLNKWDIVQNTIISLIPKTILTLNQSSDNFKVQYILFFDIYVSKRRLFRPRPFFFRFIKDNPCHTHSSSEGEIVMS